MKDIATFAGSSAAVLAIVNVVQHTTGWFERWFALVVALAVATGTTFIIKKVPPGFMPKMFTSIITGFMLYCSAFGVQNTVIHDVSGTANNVSIPAPEKRVMTAAPEVLLIPPHNAPLSPFEPMLPVWPDVPATGAQVLPEVEVQSTPKRDWSSKWD